MDWSWGGRVVQSLKARMPCKEGATTDPRAAPHHPLGPAWGDPAQTCGDCAWSGPAADGAPGVVCAAAGDLAVPARTRSCIAFQEPLDCFSCAACCGSAFDAVEADEGEPVLALHPHLFTKQFGRDQLLRTTEGFCPALDRSCNSCRIYSDRPQSCRDFTVGSSNCIFARRRVGLDPPWESLRSCDPSGEEGSPRKAKGRYSPVSGPIPSEDTP